LLAQVQPSTTSAAPAATSYSRAPPAAAFVPHTQPQSASASYTAAPVAARYTPTVQRQSEPRMSQTSYAPAPLAAAFVPPTQHQSASYSTAPNAARFTPAVQSQSEPHQLQPAYSGAATIAAESYEPQAAADAQSLTSAAYAPPPAAYPSAAYPSAAYQSGPPSAGADGGPSSFRSGSADGGHYRSGSADSSASYDLRTPQFPTSAAQQPNAFFRPAAQQVHILILFVFIFSPPTCETCLPRFADAIEI
jgi:hypothetical protein